IKRALKVFGELVVGIGVNPAKKYFFDLATRREIAEQSLKGLAGVKVIAFRGLLVDYAYENNFGTIIRGIRNSEDLNYELMLHQIGESQNQGIDTIYFPAKQELMHVSSGAVKALQLEQGLIHEFVPLFAKQKLELGISGQKIIAITGEIGAGKSHLSAHIKKLGEEKEHPVHIIDIDKIGHQILGELTAPIYCELRKEIAKKFGVSTSGEHCFIDRRRLGEIIFQDRAKLDYFNQLIYKPLLLQLRRQLYGKRGLILLDTALIAETQMSHLCNNNVVLIDIDTETQEQRLIERGYSKAQIKHRLNSQFTFNLKREMLEKRIAQDHHGKLWIVDGSKEIDLVKLYGEIETYFMDD
ncbi:MAG: pantetheine-phosphate adenylyltransferase, partial [Bacteroidota bacterium]